VLVAGGRGVGKTTLLGALLYELPAGTRTVVVEDTPELPVANLRDAGRDCQRLHVARDGTDGLGPQAALHAALRLGEGALVVGEVRGAEADALYEAMRVGTGGATLGTVHGDGAAAVRERVVTDLGVAPSAFADTDLVVTLDRTGDGRRVASVVEVVGRERPEFAPLFDDADGTVASTGRIARGNSATVAGLAGGGESYAEVTSAVETATARFG
jgi:type IV secretory pathway ATPase VirB11/archaellum biosynthesis ATPase